MKKAIAMLLVFASLMVLSAPAYATPLEQEDPFFPRKQEMRSGVNGSSSARSLRTNLTCI